ncbi:MAG: ABC transporter ATP-binding protein [Longimicrobiales bacterium]
MEGEPILALEGVFKAYEGFALRDVSFTLPPGYIMGLIGPNGAGKTTLLRMILGLARPQAGSIRVFGLDVATDGPAIRARIGFVHEHPTFFEGLPARNVAGAVAPFYPTWEEDTFRRLARDFQIPLDKKLKAYSQGMRTRFALALALSHRAKLLLLDEPSSGLDPGFRRGLLDRLAGILQGSDTSVLFSSHLTSDLDRVADFITFLRDGRVRFSMTKDEVLERHVLVKGARTDLTDELRGLLQGVVTGSFGFVGLTDDPDSVRAALGTGELLVEKATLEDVVYYTGRTGEGGLRLHDR